VKEILGKTKSIRELLNGTRYSIDYYQREYRWQKKQISDLIEDLTGCFQNDYKDNHPREEVERYGHYFLGSIIISHKNGKNFIIDGQQRLTTLTLLLIYLYNLPKHTEDDSHGIKNMIFSQKFGRKSFNIEVEERVTCMEALFENQSFDDTDSPESVQNILARYQDINDLFPTELMEKPLPYFIDWLIENVRLVEITAYNDEDAYTIFETMNDRGLSLTPTEMLKGYLLANITDSKTKARANENWKKIIDELNRLGKDENSDFFKSWLRSQKAETIRGRKKDAIPGDFDRIGTEFHRWIRDKSESLGLLESSNFEQWIEGEIKFYAYKYISIRKASISFTEGLEHIFYNAQNDFTQQYQLLLASLLSSDSKKVIRAKLRMVSIFLDILLTRRIWNSRSITYSTMQYTIFLLTKEIRDKAPNDLAQILIKKLADYEDDFDKNPDFSLHGKNRNYILRILARITDYLETTCKQHGEGYVGYVTAHGQKQMRYEVEHILPNKPGFYTNEFPDESEFQKFRNKIGGLLLLPKKFNTSYGALPYTEKRSHYNGQNILARTLCLEAYNHNPGLTSFIKDTGIQLRPHAEFKKADLEERQALYLELAKRVWNPELITAELQKLS
jgi:uncharacterized protein with ParB-like and HNH nuclease domain